MATSQSANVGLFSVRVPPFITEEPSFWFAQLEGQFSLINITEDSAKFWTTVALLNSRASLEAKDIITNPPSENKYEPDITTDQIPALKRWKASSKCFSTIGNVGRESICRLFNHGVNGHNQQRTSRSGISCYYVQKIPHHWPLARVVATHPGDDNRVRVVTVKTAWKSWGSRCGLAAGTRLLTTALDRAHHQE
ncbi:hypothetical protein J437_LFUL008936 [Ladona fulva]|uniref:Uncharacterized protein n=1 Tax=Ladona fulva TaxID=123851 RepID=A0A8K0KIY8_LADFU|nr:hypothetical protein J437_LFUL008936 [Ladona fulva]